MEDEAASWVVRLASDQRTRADEAAFREWLAGDPAHADAFGECHAVWAGLGALADQEEARETLMPQPIAAPGFWTRRRLVTSGIGAVAAAGLGVAVVPRLLGTSFTTAPGEQRTLHLADGSTVVLNTDSALKVAFTQGERRLFLDRGQAFFHVAKDKARPFRVFVGNYEVRAIGTAFDVRRIGDSAHVTLEEGKVAIYHGDSVSLPAVQSAGAPQPAAAKPAALLDPGQQAVLAAAEPIAIRPADLKKTEAWRNGEIILDSTPLGDIVADLNRYGGPQIELADPALANIRVSGVFHTGRPDVFVEAVATAFPVRVREQDASHIVLDRR
jgi:transmembrane sensor